jgi:hypothetical protein
MIINSISDRAGLRAFLAVVVFLEALGLSLFALGTWFLGRHVIVVALYVPLAVAFTVAGYLLCLPRPGPAATRMTAILLAPVLLGNIAWLINDSYYLLNYEQSERELLLISGEMAFVVLLCSLVVLFSVSILRRVRA